MSLSANRTQAAILCGADGTEHADRAVAFAARLAADQDRPLILILVNRTRPASGFPDLRDWSEAEAEAILRAASERAVAHGVSARLVLLEHAQVARALIDTAEEFDADHIVVGAGDPSRFGQLLLGSVGRDLANQARCTLTIVR